MIMKKILIFFAVLIVGLSACSPEQKTTMWISFHSKPIKIRKCFPECEYSEAYRLISADGDTLFTGDVLMDLPRQINKSDFDKAGE